MSTPTHGYDCRSRTYPTRCRYCGSDIFYFECSDGSKVFFSQLGGLWPVHSCAEYALARQQADETAAVRSAFRTPSRQGITIRRITPFEGRPSVVGRVMEIGQANLLRRLGYVDSPIGRGLLGRLVTRPQVEVTVREEPVGTARICDEYRFFVEARLAEQCGLRQGSLAVAELELYQIPDGRCLWVARRLDGGTV